MARATFSKPITAFQGILDHLVSRQMKSGNVAVSHISQSREKPTKAQANHERNESIRFHPVYEELAQALNQTPYEVALSDRMSPPVIHRILLRGSNILIQASDNVMVTKVEVQVLGEQGEVLEQGEAVRLKGDWWEYMPSFAGVTITAAAWDLAGNVTKAEM